MTNTYLKSLMLMAALGLSAVAMPTIADETTGARAAQNTVVDFVSANDAKRLARRYLGKLGFDRSIGPGGASVRQVTLNVDTWVVEVRLRGHSATNVSNHLLYISTETGTVSEVAPKGSSNAANPIASVR